MAVSLAQLDLAALRLFLAVAQTGRISGGALVSHLSVAAASKRISDLELRLGYKLFDRHARGVVATAAGERVAAYAREVVGLYAWEQIGRSLALLPQRLPFGGVLTRQQ